MVTGLRRLVDTSTNEVNDYHICIAVTEMAYLTETVQMDFDRQPVSDEQNIGFIIACQWSVRPVIVGQRRIVASIDRTKHLCTKSFVIRKRLQTLKQTRSSPQC